MRPQKHSGIALIQVLLIVALLSVYALYMSGTAKQQLELAAVAQDRAQVEVDLHDALSQITYSALTHSFEKQQTESVSEIAQRWNFYSDPFKTSTGVTVKLQDLSAKLSLHFLDKTYFIPLLARNGVSYQRASEIADRLLDWQDIDNIPEPQGYEAENQVRNGFIPDITEIEHIVDLTEKEKQLIFDNLTTFYVGSLNPLNASEELLRVVTDEAAASHLVDVRRQRRINRFDFRDITGVNRYEEFRFAASLVISIELHKQIGEAAVTKQYVIAFSPYVIGREAPINKLVEQN